jgi:NTP pyrophosphatase (non-canonical NTP hydrolase)
MEMKFSEYQQMCKRTMPPNKFAGIERPYYNRDKKVNYMMGLAGEVGEFIDLIKKEWYHGHPIDHDKRKKELGDVFHYLFGICEMFGYSAEEIATMNIMKLKERYPNGFSEEDSIKRVDVDETEKA